MSDNRKCLLAETGGLVDLMLFLQVVIAYNSDSTTYDFLNLNIKPLRPVFNILPGSVFPITNEYHYPKSRKY